MKQSGFNKKQEWGDDEDDEDYEVCSKISTKILYNLIL